MKNLFKLLSVAVISMSLAVGCAAQKMEVKNYSGFLGDYSKLQAGPEGGVAQRYITPGVDFKKYKRIMLDQVLLYFKNDAADKGIVYIYFNTDVTQPPNFYFGDDVPEMQDVIDLTVSNDFLFLLHCDGRLTKCSYSGFAESPTRCEDPANYDDPRPGRSGGVVIPDALFSQFSSSPHPGPVLYMLEPTHQSVYMFSLRQTFQQQYRPATDLGEEPATSFAVSTSRVISSPSTTRFITLGFLKEKGKRISSDPPASGLISLS